MVYLPGVWLPLGCCIISLRWWSFQTKLEMPDSSAGDASWVRMHAYKTSKTYSIYHIYMIMNVPVLENISFWQWVNFNRSTFRICSPIRHISITRSSYKLIHNHSQAKREWDVYHLWISDGRNFSSHNGHSILAGKPIPSHRPNDYLIMLQWFIPDETMCHQ